jgi:hypothetical protein
VLSGNQPFAAETPARMIKLLTTVDPAPLSGLVPECPPGLQRLVETAMAKDRQRRYQSMQEVLLDLTPIEATLRMTRAAELAQESAVVLETGDLERAELLLHRSLDLDPASEKGQELRRLLQKGGNQPESHHAAVSRSAPVAPGGAGTTIRKRSARLASILIPALVVTFAVRLFFNTSAITRDRPLSLSETLIIFVVVLLLAMLMRSLAGLALRVLKR